MQNVDCQPGFSEFSHVFHPLAIKPRASDGALGPGELGCWPCLESAADSKGAPTPGRRCGGHCPLADEEEAER